VPGHMLAEDVRRLVEAHIPDVGSVSLRGGERLAELVRREGARDTLEVGFAYGVSALSICAAAPEGSTHTVIDPYQREAYADAGLQLLDAAGLRPRLTYYEESSHVVLPHLLAEGREFDFAFVDASHQVDFTMLELFYCDLLVRPGGLIVFDDANLPGVRKVLRYAVAARGYRDESLLADTGRARRAGRRAKRLVGGLRAVPSFLAFVVGPERHEHFESEFGWPRADNFGVLRKPDEPVRPHWRATTPF
jgi:predicted O-methyltransferase YrrM